jgi:hypothetical protein
MCRKVDCKTCKKPTWAGCGQHIESALRDVKIEDRCMGWKSGICVPLSNNASAQTTEKKT